MHDEADGEGSDMYEGMEAEMSGEGGPGMHDESGEEDDMEGMEGDMDGTDPSEMYAGMEGGPGMYRGAGGPGQGNRPGQAKKPKTFADMADMAFQQGRDKEAFQYLFAHAVTADDAPAGELLGKMGWIGPAKRPGLAVRWGIGIEFNSGGHDGNIYPMGTNQKMPERGRARGRADGGLGDGGIGYGTMDAGVRGVQGGGGGQVNAKLQQYTGELGEKLVEGLQNRAARGDYGEVLKSAKAAGTQRQGRGGMGYGGAGMEMGGYGAASNGEGMGGYGDESDGEGMGGGFGAGRAGRGPGSEDSVTQLFPGAALLGPAPVKDLLKLAEETDVNVLCVFIVTVKPNVRTGQVSTTYKIQLYNVADGKKEFETKQRLNNIAVQVARADEKSRGGDPVDEAMEKLFEHIDSNWKIARMPALQKEHVLNRISGLLAQTHENPLPVLAEIRMYHTRGLLQDEHFLLAYQRKLNNDQLGTTLATGTEEERKQVIAEWMP
jgi:hypothetical protein